MYGIRYKINSINSDNNWQYACNKTKQTSCELEIDGDLIGATVIYTVLAATKNKRLYTSSGFYRSWPTLVCK